MGDLLRGDQVRQLRALLPWLGLFLVAALSIPPLFERGAVGFVAPRSAVATLAGKWLVLAAMLVAVAVRALADRRAEPGAAARALLFAALAGLMTACHWYVVDSQGHAADWQRATYLSILGHTMDAPHQFRPLPYGFVRTLERLTGDWWFSCVAYRWFFTYWFLWGSHHFARLFLSPGRALLTVAPLAALYPLSVWYYWGQLTDPLSHALFALALVCAVQDRWLALAASLALGVLAKETVVLMVPAYYACYWREGRRGLAKAALLGAVCVAAFLAARLPFGWFPGYEKINGTERLMIADNLGIGEPYYQGAAPLYQNYLHPALFVAPFLPLIARGWRRIDGRLKALCLTLVPLVLLSNVCFGWLYESRNYMPLVPLLATAALAGAMPKARAVEAAPA